MFGCREFSFTSFADWTSELVDSTLSFETKLSKMKFVVCAVLLLLSVCIVTSVNVSTWGRISNRTMGTTRVEVRGTRFQVKNYTLTYPQVNWVVQLDSTYYNCFKCTDTFDRRASKFLIKTNILNLSQGNSRLPIVGIQHLDYEFRPTSVRFLKGGIGQQNVTLFIQSQRDFGINSTFVFYTL